MKPEQFIREFGVEKAREVVAACPEYYHYYHIVEGVYYTCPKASRVAVKDLKRLVESVDLVESWGGIDDVKLYDLSHCKNKPESAGYKLLQAIADHESIYGGGDE
ncbi:hypothetical protein [Acinetobacter baumannii]|mgnify:CR=1 FL=1|uniref:hypothetical protein n=1 Tax=Acinetobacter baumannii TaxID=470 RepID=UPI0011233427|nr:hypothetical protein [Acinetobacter baumannii]MBD0230815.1 hypothetical protein [Acinetobacter baumannii]MBL4061962.1 hypothetical protein [Acinetobacter baumannii]MBP4148684.1 hypothetical protein [Acinetobacter baumannii]MBP4156249.1 hypothetical protein [Acinetobacter baumannii]MBP4167425.1 hypothetical protein [Acinetobacter baumannii]